MKILRKEKEWFILIVTGLISLVMVYGFWICPKGGLLSNGLMDKKNFYYQSEQEVRKLGVKGFEGGDQFSFVLPFEKGLLKEDLLFLLEFHKKVKNFFPEYGILSLAKAIDYKQKGELGYPYVNEEMFQNSDWNLEEWRAEIKKNPGVYEVLVGKNFDYAQIIVFLPSNYSEIDIRNRIASLLEDRNVITWEWFIKSDVYPVVEYEKILVSGWPFGRGLMDAALISDILKFSTIGLLLVIFVLYPLNGSIKQSFYCWLIIVLGLFWIRGTVGYLFLLDVKLAGEAIKERVYMLFVFTAIIIAGISFSTRKFDSYNSYREKFPELLPQEIWKKTRRFNGKIYIVAIIAIFGFLTLYSIENRGLIEMGILSAIGIFYLVVMTRWLLPALQVIFGGDVVEKEKNRIVKMGEIFLVNVTEGLYRILTYFPRQKTFWLATIFSLVVIVGALIFVGHDFWVYKNFDINRQAYIKTGTNPIDYLKGTIVDRARLFLNQQDRYGFGKLSFLVQVKEGDVYDPEVIRAYYYLQKKAQEIEGIKTSKSIVDTVLFISKRQYGLDFPETRQQVQDIFSTIEWDLGFNIFNQLQYEKGINIILSLLADDSNQLERQAELMVKLIDKGGLNFKCLPFGRLHYYHQTDKYIQKRQPANMITSFIIVMVCCSLWLKVRSSSFLDEKKQIYVLYKIRTGVAMAIPFVFSSACIVYLMVLCKIPLDQAMACIVPLAINAAIDFNLHFIDDFNDALMGGSNYQKALKIAICEKGKVNIVDILVNAFCFAFLIFSNFNPIALTGVLLVFMMFTCGFGALVLMPAILFKCIKKTSQKVEDIGIEEAKLVKLIN